MRFVRIIAIIGLLLLLSCAGGGRRNMSRGDQSLGVVQFAVQTANVLDEENLSRLWVIVDVPYRNLMFERLGGKFVSRFEVTVALRSKAGHAVQLIDDAGRVEVSTYDATQPDSLYARIARFMTAPAGEYQLEAVLTDRVSKGSGYYSRPVLVRDLNTDDLTLSDIILLKEQPEGKFPATDLVLPAYKRRFDTTFYAFSQALNVTAGTKMHATLSTGENSATVGTVALSDSSALNKVSNVLFPIPPTILGLGRLELKIEVSSELASAQSTRPIIVRWATRPTYAAALDNYIAPMRLVMNGREWKELESAPTEMQRELIAEFWSKRNPAPDTKANLLEEEFYWRVGEANARFTWGKRPGWDSDRGRVYVIHGAPSNVGRRQDQMGRAIEVWRYEDPSREFVFYDDHGDGRFRLYSQSYSS